MQKKTLSYIRFNTVFILCCLGWLLLTTRRGPRPEVRYTPGPCRRGTASPKRTPEDLAPALGHAQTGEVDLETAVDESSSMFRTWLRLTLSRSSLSIKATGWPWRFPEGDVSGVFTSACASTQMTQRSGHCWAWPATDPIPRLWMRSKWRLINKWEIIFKNWRGGWGAVSVVTCGPLPAWPRCDRHPPLCSQRPRASLWQRPPCEGTSRSCRAHPSSGSGNWGRQSRAQRNLTPRNTRLHVLHARTDTQRHMGFVSYAWSTLAAD